MQTVKYHIKSLSPFLFHNVNSMDLVKPADMTHAEFESSEEMFRGRLYLEGDKLILPPRVIIGALKVASQKSGIKQPGKRATFANVIRAITFVLDPGEFSQTIEDVVEHKEYVTVQRSKVLRVFPMLKEWDVKFTLHFDPKQISKDAIESILKYCGSYVGLGDYRPQHGRFTVEEI